MSRRRQRGFTILELMVALVIGGLVVAAVFTLGGASARHFQEQQRIGITQRSVRMAMDRLARDIARAGYLGVPDTTSPQVRMCPQPSPRPLQAIAFTNDAGTGELVNSAANRVSADQLVLTGNYATSDSYLVRSFNGNGSQLILQSDWVAFQRTFVNPDTTLNVARFTQDVFAPGRALHIQTGNGFHFVVNITASSLTVAGATINITPALGQDNPCLRGLGRGAVVSPISQIRYSIGPASPALAPRNAAVTGPNTVLYRDELNITDGELLRRQPILEWAVDFNLDFIVDVSTPGLPPNLQRRTGTEAFQPWQVRSVIASLAARTPEQDRRFPWVPRAAGAPLNRYQVFPGRDGAARVRQLRTEISTPNLVPRPR